MIDDKPGDSLLNSSYDSNEENEVDENGSFKMLTRGAGTLAFAAPERLIENCFYT